jgi:cold shock CspA family protein
MITRGRVSWFKLDKKFGFIELDGAIGDAFVHVSVLKGARLCERTGRDNHACRGRAATRPAPRDSGS